MVIGLFVVFSPEVLQANVDHRHNADLARLHRGCAGGHGCLYRHRDHLEHGRRGDRPAAPCAAIDHVRRPRRIRDLRVPTVGGAVGAAGGQGDAADGAGRRHLPVHQLPGPAGGGQDVGARLPLLGRPGRRAGREPRPAADDHRRPRLLRRDPGGHHPDHRHQRRHHRRLAIDVLDGAAPPAARGDQTRASEVQHAVRGDLPLQLRGDPDDDPDRSHHVPGEPVRLRRHALVHAGARGRDSDAADHARPGDAMARTDVLPMG